MNYTKCFREIEKDNLNSIKNLVKIIIKVELIMILTSYLNIFIYFLICILK